MNLKNPGIYWYRDISSMTQMFLKRQALALEVHERKEASVDEKIAAVEVLRASFSGKNYDKVGGADLSSFANDLLKKRRAAKKLQLTAQI